MKKKYPKEAGYYWVRYTDAGGEPFITTVREDKSRNRFYVDEGVAIPLHRFPVDWISERLEPPNTKESVKPAHNKPPTGSQGSPKLPSFEELKDALFESDEMYSEDLTTKQLRCVYNKIKKLGNIS